MIFLKRLLLNVLDSDADDSVNLGGNRPRRKASIPLVTSGILEFVNGLDNMIKMNYAAAVAIAAAGAAIGDENGTPFALRSNVVQLVRQRC